MIPHLTGGLNEAPGRAKEPLMALRRSDVTGMAIAVDDEEATA